MGGKFSKFLILAYHYPPSPAVGATRPSHFAKYLQKFGFFVQVLTATPQPETPQDPVTHVKDPVNPLRKNTLSGLAHMTLRKLIFPFEDSVIWSWNLLSEAEKLISKAPRDWVVFSTFPPVSTHLAALRLRQKYPVRWVADFRDPLAGSDSRRTALDHLPTVVRSLSPAADQWIEKRIVDRADLLIANTDVVADLWRRRYPPHARKITHIWNGFDLDDTMEARPIPPRPYKVMSHVGGLYHGRRPDFILESLDRLVTSGRLKASSFRLQFVGQINYDGIANRAVFDRLVQTGCVEATGMLTQSEARKAAGEADYLLLLDWNQGLQVPAKTFEYVRIGRPIFVVTSPESPVDRILQSSQIPYCSVSSDTPPPVLDEKFLQFLDLPTESCKPSPWFFDQFDASHRVSTLVRQLESLA